MKWFIILWNGNTSICFFICFHFLQRFEWTRVLNWTGKMCKLLCVNRRLFFFSLYEINQNTWLEFFSVHIFCVKIWINSKEKSSSGKILFIELSKWSESKEFAYCLHITDVEWRMIFSTLAMFLQTDTLGSCHLFEKTFIS